LQLWHYRHMLRPDSSAGQERLWVRFHCRSVFQHLGRKNSVTTVPLDTLGEEPAADSEERSELLERLATVLNEREHRVLDLVLDGYGNGEIAEAMHLKEKVVLQLRYSMMEKMKKKAQEI